MLYPTFEYCRGLLLPRIELPKDYQELIIRFYEQNKKEKIEEYALIIKENFLPITRKLELKWNKTEGLININIGLEGGLDFTNNLGFPHFKEHNLTTRTAIPTGLIAMKYVSELLKSK